MSAESSLLIVVGLGREARIVADRARILIGTGGLAAAMAKRPAGVLSFGLCGALDPAFEIADLFIADAVISGAWRYPSDVAWTRALGAAFPSARTGVMAGSGQIVATPAARSELREATGAAAVDMESHAVAVAAQTAGIPFAVLRAVSDSATRALPRSAQAGFKADGEPDIGAVIRALAVRPWELPALIRVAFEAERTFTALRRAAAAAILPPPQWGGTGRESGQGGGV